VEVPTESYRSILDCVTEGVYMVDPDRTIIFWNRGAEEITGYGSHEAVGRRCRDNLLEHCNENGENLCLTQCPLSGAMKDGEPRAASVFVKHKSGHRVPIRIQALPLYDAAAKLIGAVEIFEDMSAHRLRTPDAAVHTQWRDNLTGIASHALIAAQLEAWLRLNRDGRAPGGAILVGIDGIDDIAHKYGRDAALLGIKTVAHGLSICSRARDLIGRWHDDQFLGILETTRQDDVRITAERLRALVSASAFQWWGDNVTVTISGGATLLKPGDTMDAVLRRLESGREHSKHAGGNQIHLI
jgi:diguanylate cyclase (GGDEF)-like protein/PAS domain S-box-containing protein